MPRFLASLSLLFFLNHAIEGFPPGRPDEPNLDDYPSKCLIEEGEGDVIDRMMCTPVGHDGRTLGQILREVQAFSNVRSGPTYFETAPGTQGRGPALSFAPRVKHLHLIIAGNLTITDNCFKGFTNLKYLNTNLFNPMPSPEVTIARNAFQHTPNLKRLRLSQAYYFPEETLQALESVKDQITDISISECSPEDGILEVASKFSKLTDFYMNLWGPSCPHNLFQNSAKSLNKIHLLGCNMTHLSAAMLANLGKLTNLRLVRSNIETVQPGAFDELINLKCLYMMGNRIKLLPEGIFNKNNNLEIVDINGNGLENLSTNNFTHCPNFKKLCLSDFCPVFCKASDFVWA